MLDTATLLPPEISAFGQIIGGNYDHFLMDYHKVKQSETTKPVIKGLDNHFVFSANLIGDNTKNFVCRSQCRRKRAARTGEHTLDELS